MPYGEDGKVFMVYLAGPVDGVAYDESAGWRGEVAKEFPNVMFFMPNLAYRNVNLRTMPAVDHMNKHAIRCSDAVIANLTGAGRALGTMREIEFARMHSIYVGLAANPGDVNDSLMIFDLHVAKTPILAMQAAVEFLASRANAPVSFMGIPIEKFKHDPEDQDD